jgi:hypothetical protein
MTGALERFAPLLCSESKGKLAHFDLVTGAWHAKDDQLISSGVYARTEISLVASEPFKRYWQVEDWFSIHAQRHFLGLLGMKETVEWYRAWSMGKPNRF